MMSSLLSWARFPLAISGTSGFSAFKASQVVRYLDSMGLNLDGSKINPSASVSYTHLDVYKRQILMMAEKQSIIGIGAGSSGKLYVPEIDRFDRIFTVKDVKTYNERTEEIVEKKMAQYEAFFGERV